MVDSSSVLGLGTAQLTEGLHDVSFATQVRALLNGERAPLFTTPQTRQLRLNLPAKPELPIYIAGLAHKTLRLTGELADGWLPFLFARDQLTDGIALLQEGKGRRASCALPLWPH